jgi:hypothetical protein
MGQQLQILSGQFRFCLLASRPARHSVTPRCWLVSLSLSRLNLWAWKVSIDWFSHPKIEMEWRWQVFSLVERSSEPNTGTALGRQTGPRTPQIFITLLLSHIVRMEEYRCHAGTTPCRCYRNAKNKLKPLLLTPPCAEGLNSGLFATLITIQPLSHMWPQAHVQEWLQE